MQIFLSGVLTREMDEHTLSTITEQEATFPCCI